MATVTAGVSRQQAAPVLSVKGGIAGSLRSEFTKIRSVRSTYLTLIVLVLASVGLLLAGPGVRVCDGILRLGCVEEATGAAVAAELGGGRVTKIAILDDYIGVALEYGDWSALPDDAEVTVYREAIPPERLADELADYEVVVITQQRARFPRAVLEGLPKLKLIVCNGRTSNVVDHEARIERGILLSGTADTGQPAGARPSGYGAGRGLPGPSELAWALILAVAKRAGIEDRVIRAGGWQTGFPVPLAGKTLGLLGAGHLGGAMVPVAKAFGMDVVAWSQNLTGERCAELGVRRVTKDELLASSDVLGVFLVFSERSRNTLRADDLAKMKSGAILVNISRGPIVEEKALVEALRSGHLAGAGLDVFDREPLPADHPFRSLDNVVVTPHVGYVTEQLFRTAWQRMAQDVAAYLAGSPIRVVTDPADCPPMAPQ
jgi:phosphoglycerate dehydrogenase-like enzyme